MGMFDYVRYKAECPECGYIVSDWQTKDTDCTMATVEPWQVKHFYTECRGCSTWLTATVDAEVEHIVKRCDITLKAK